MGFFNMVMSWFGKNERENEEKVKQEKMSYKKYKDFIKRNELENVKKVKILPPSFFGSNEKKIKVEYKKPVEKNENKKTKRVVHDQRQIKMQNPDLNKNDKPKSKERWRNTY